jgi:hypothetical protein
VCDLVLVAARREECSMQVKVCPKCGAENKPDKASCSGCYSSLEGVVETEAKARPAPEPNRPQAQAPPAAQPLSGSPLTGPATPAGPTPADNYTPPPGAPSPYGAPMTFPEKRSAPVSRGTNWIAIVLVVVLLGGAAYGGWWYYTNKIMGPDKIVQRFLDAAKAGDYEKMKACLTQSFINKIQAVPGGEEKVKADLPSQISKMDGNITGVTYDEKNSSLAYVAVEVSSKQQLPPGMTSLDMVCSKENGRWKVDLEATGARLVSKMMSGRGMSGMPMPSQ